MRVAITINGPNGMGSPRLIFPNVKPIIPIIAPINVERKKASKTPDHPKVIPMTANNLMSPPPIPPLLIMAMASSKVKPITPPKNGFHHVSKGATNKRMTKRIGAKKSKT